VEPPVLKPQQIIETIERLHLRIKDRFPASGLADVCAKLHEIAKETQTIVNWISKPSYPIRLTVAFVLLILVLALVYSVSQLKLDAQTPTPRFCANDRGGP
jgi:hypothetical protein